MDIVFLDLITTYDTGPLLTNKLMQPGLGEQGGALQSG